MVQGLLVKAGIQVTQILDESLQTILRIKEISEEQKEDLYFEDRNKEIEKRMKELEDELCKNKKLASYYMRRFQIYLKVLMNLPKDKVNKIKSYE